MPPSEMLDKIRDLLARTPEVEFAYLFGSHARGDVGALSDIDIAVHVRADVSPFGFRLRLMESFARDLGAERFDLVTLNDASIVLKYEVIRVGKVIKEEKEARVAFEAKVLGEYLDTAYMRRVQEFYLKEQLSRGGAHGE